MIEKEKLKKNISDIIFIFIMFFVIIQAKEMFFEWLKYNNNYVINIPLDSKKGMVFKEVNDKNITYKIVIFYNKRCELGLINTPISMCVTYEIFDKNNKKILSGNDYNYLFNDEFLIKKQIIK